MLLDSYSLIFVYTEVQENYPKLTLLKHEQMLFTLEALIEATNNFAEKKKLGERGFCPEYKVCIYLLLLLSLTHELS